MEANGKDYKVGLQITGDPRIAHARVREQTPTHALVFIKLRMFTLHGECHLQNKKGISRPVYFEDVFSLAMPDGMVWAHLKLTFKHANTNDQAEDVDAPVWIHTAGYPDPIKCLVNMSAPRYMLVRTELFAFISKNAEGTLEDPRNGKPRKIKIEDAFMQVGTDGVPEFVIRLEYLDQPNPEQVPDQAKHDTPLPPSDPHRPSIMLSRQSAAPELVRDSELMSMDPFPPNGAKSAEAEMQKTQQEIVTVVTPRTKREKRMADLRKTLTNLNERVKTAWRPVDRWSARNGKYVLIALMIVAALSVFLIQAPKNNKPRTVPAGAANSAANVVQPTASVSDMSSIDIAGVSSASTAASVAPAAAPAAVPVASAPPAEPLAAASAAPAAIPAAPVCIRTTPKNLRLFFLQSDPACMSGKISDTHQVGDLHIRCPNEPVYDQARKCTDVSKCEICLPTGKAAAPGAHDFTDALASVYYHQGDASCFIEPSLPFRVDPKDLRNGLRIDLDCKDFSFDPVNGCFDYSKCKLIVPTYDR